MLTIMVLATEEEVFIVEHYFRSYGVGRQTRQTLRHVREHYELSSRSSTVWDQSCVNGRLLLLLGFTTLFSVASDIEREKADKFCSEALISA